MLQYCHTISHLNVVQKVQGHTVCYFQLPAQETVAIWKRVKNLLYYATE